MTTLPAQSHTSQTHSQRSVGAWGVCTGFLPRAGDAQVALSFRIEWPAVFPRVFLVTQGARKACFSKLFLSFSSSSFSLGPSGAFPAVLSDAIAAACPRPQDSAAPAGASHLPTRFSLPPLCGPGSSLTHGQSGPLPEMAGH